MIDIQNELIMAQINIQPHPNAQSIDSMLHSRNKVQFLELKRRQQQRSSKITSLFYDEKSQSLLLGYFDGEVDILMASTAIGHN